MKKIIFILFILCFPILAEAQIVPATKITVTEEDGSPSGRFGILKFSNGTVTDNLNGTVSIDNDGVGVVGDITDIGDCSTGSCFVVNGSGSENNIYFEGTTANGFELDLRGGDPSADVVVTIPAENGTICTTGSICSGYASSSSISTKIQDADADTKVDTEESADEDKIRFNTGGTKRAYIDSNGLVLDDGSGVSGGLFFVNNGGLTSYILPSGDDLYISANGIPSGDVIITNAGAGIMGLSVEGLITASSQGLSGPVACSNCIALSSETTGNYVQSVSTNTVTGLTGGSGGSEGTIITLGLDYTSTLAGNPAIAANLWIPGTTGLLFEGATADTSEMLVTAADATSDITITIPAVTGTLLNDKTLQDSGRLALVLGDESGTGNVAYTTSPVFTTPNIGSATGSITGNAGTATALAANGANCTAGNYPLGVDTLGAVEDCTAVGAGGDSITVNSSTAADANFLDGDIDWTLNTASSPDDITATVGCSDCVTLATETAGDYVASVGTTILTGLTGGMPGSENAALNLAFDYTATIGADPALAAGNVIFGTTGIIFEGSAANAAETLLTIANPGSDITITFPATTGNVITSGDSLTITSGMVGNNSVALGTKTTGNYAGGNAEGGAALTGDNAAAFFSGGALELNRGGTNEQLTDPGDDQILFWDDDHGGTGAIRFLDVGDGLSITATTLSTSVTLAAGVWTATANDIANLDASSTAAEGQYMRVGNTVTGSVQITVNPTLTTTSTQTELDLPVSSNFGAGSDAAGVCAAPGITGMSAAITADATSDELEIRWISTDVTAQEMDCSFSYQVI